MSGPGQAKYMSDSLNHLKQQSCQGFTVDFISMECYQQFRLNKDTQYDATCVIP